MLKKLYNYRFCGVIQDKNSCGGFSLLLWFSILLLLSGILRPVLLFSAGQPGAFLSWGTGARHLALGNAAIGVSEDVFSLYYNPGALGFIQQKEIGTFHAMLWEETAYSYLGYVHPIFDKSAIGFDIVRLFSGDAIKTDEYNRRLGEFSFQQLAIGVGYGRSIYEKLSLGLCGKLFISNLDTASYNSFLVNIGGVLKVNEVISLGANLQNIFSVTIGDTSDSLPFIATFGGGYKVFGDKLNFLLDFGKDQSNSSIINFYSLGVESKLNRFFALRIGRNIRETTGGFGVNFKNLNFDYALAHHYLGFSHRVSFNFRFGPTLTEIRRSKVVTRKEKEDTPALETLSEHQLGVFQENYQEGVSLYRRGLFTFALEKFKNAAAIDPTDTIVPLYIDRLSLIIPIVPQNISPDKVSELLRRGVSYFIEGYGQNAVKVLAYALSLEPDNFTVMRLLSTIEEKTGYRVERTKPMSGLTIVDQKLYESLIAFRKRNYHETIRLCEEILLLEPDNALAYRRLGSAFYALGEKDKAKKMWEKSIEIEPDKKISELLKRIK